MSGTKRLRYTGRHPTAFTGHGIGQVEEGAEFSVPADQAERYLRRGDVALAREDNGKRPVKRARTDDAASEEGSDEAHG